MLLVDEDALQHVDRDPDCRNGQQSADDVVRFHLEDGVLPRLRRSGAALLLLLAGSTVLPAVDLLLRRWWRRPQHKTDQGEHRQKDHHARPETPDEAKSDDGQSRGGGGDDGVVLDGTAILRGGRCCGSNVCRHGKHVAFHPPQRLGQNRLRQRGRDTSRHEAQYLQSPKSVRDDVLLLFLRRNSLGGGYGDILR